MLKKITALTKQLGGPSTVLYLISKSVGYFSNSFRLIYYLIVAQPVAAQPLLPPHRGKNFHFELLTGPSPVLKGLPRPASVIENRFKQGSKCIVATLHSDFVGCIWLQHGSYIEDEVRSVFTPDSPRIAWDYDVYVCEEQRLGFLFTKLWDEASEYLRNEGISWTCSRISGFNPASIAAHRRLGALPIQRIIYLVLGTIQFTISNRRPWIHLSASPRRQPIIPLTRARISYLDD